MPYHTPPPLAPLLDLMTQDIKIAKFPNSLLKMAKSEWPQIISYWTLSHFSKLDLNTLQKKNLGNLTLTLNRKKTLIWNAYFDILFD